MKLKITLDYDFVREAYGADDGDIFTPWQAAPSDYEFYSTVGLEDFIGWLNEKKIPYILEERVEP